MKKILITGAGGSTASYLCRSLEKKYQIILCDANPDCAGLHSKYKSYVVPFGSDPKFEEVLTKIIEENNIDYAAPGCDTELSKFWNMKEKFGNLRLILPNKDFIDLSLNKKELMEKLRDKKISDIKTYTKQKAMFPAFVKPIKGSGSRNAHKINSKDQLEGYFKLYGYNEDEVLIQEFIGGQEYTVSVIVNNKNKIINIVPKKIIFKRGITRIAVSEKNEEINRVCKQIVEFFKPCGPFNVQLVVREEIPYIFEINPRISTTTVLTSEVAGNEIELVIDNFDKENINSDFDFEENVFMARYEESIFYEAQK
jgi:carbamoyl-phosphate synthase large subunit